MTRSKAIYTDKEYLAAQFGFVRGDVADLAAIVKAFEARITALEKDAVRRRTVERIALVLIGAGWTVILGVATLAVSVYADTPIGHAVSLRAE